MAARSYRKGRFILTQDPQGCGNLLGGLRQDSTGGLDVSLLPGIVRPLKLGVFLIVRAKGLDDAGQGCALLAMVSMDFLLFCV